MSKADFFKRYWDLNRNAEVDSVQLVGEAIDILHPYFGISPSAKCWDKTPAPTVFVRYDFPEDYGEYYGYQDQDSEVGPGIHLPVYKGDHQALSVGGHEVGHFLHDLKNHRNYQEIVSLTSQNNGGASELWEAVANYAEILFLSRKLGMSNPVRSSAFSLHNLANINGKGISLGLEKRITIFHEVLKEIRIRDI